MRVSSLAPPGQRLVALLAALILLPSAVLVGFGWRMLRQDRVIEQAQFQTRREQTADLVVTALQQALADVEQRLRHPRALAATLGTGAAVVVVQDDDVRAYPAGRVPH
jgi:hypothetical protein